MYLHVLLVNDTVEASDLLSLLGVGLLKFAQTLVYLAQNNISKEGADVHADGDILAIVTIVTERYRTQYALIYTTRMQEAVTDKQILASDPEELEAGAKYEMQ